MRGTDSYNESLCSTIQLKDFVPVNHPPRPIRIWINEALAKTGEVFSAMYGADIRGLRPSIAPEKQMRATLLQVLFFWFLGVSIDDAAWNHSVFSKTRDRLIKHEVMIEFFSAR